MRAARARASCTRSARVTRRAAEAVSASPPRRLRSEIGSPSCTHTLRPLTSTEKPRRSRLPKAQSSESIRRIRERSFCGARPQYMPTGTSATSSCGSAWSASISTDSSWGGAPVQARAPEAHRPLEREGGAHRGGRRTQQAAARPREPCVLAQRMEHREIHRAVPLQHVADRRRTVAQPGAGVGRVQTGARPQRDEPGKERVHGLKLMPSDTQDADRSRSGNARRSS